MAKLKLPKIKVAKIVEPKVTRKAKVAVVPVPKPVPTPGGPPTRVNINPPRCVPKVVHYHVHNYGTNIPGPRNGLGPRPPAPTGIPVRPRPVAPANKTLRFSGNPNAFKYGRGGPGNAGI